MQEIIGFLKDEGYSQGEIVDALGGLVDNNDVADFGDSSDDPIPNIRNTNADDDGMVDPIYSDDDRVAMLHRVLKVARDLRQPPGRMVAIPGPLLNVAPGQVDTSKARPVRVDTEDSYRDFRRRQASGGQGGGGRDIIDRLSSQAASELMGEVSVEDLNGIDLDPLDDSGPASRFMLGRMLGVDLDPLGDYVGPASQFMLGGGPCLLCGKRSGANGLCPICNAKKDMAVLGDLDYPNASAMYQDGEQLHIADMLGTQFEYFAASEYLLGAFGDYATASDFMLGVNALDAFTASVYGIEDIPLSYNKRDQPHLTSWKSGDNLYSSMRVMGWDGQPKIITSTTPFKRAAETVLGYVERAGIDPARAQPMLDSLTRQLGASSLVPPMAAASPGILELAREQSAPFKTVIAPWLLK
jgi:hypothetical protein